MSMEAYVSRAPRKPKSCRMDLNKALNIMGYNGWSELVPGNELNLQILICMYQYNNVLEKIYDNV